MGSRIVRQPNGLFARFSDVVDHFTNMNLTEDQAIESCLENGCSRQEAEDKLDRATRDLKPFSTAEGSGLDRWNHCLGIIERVHGKLDMEEAKKRGEFTWILPQPTTSSESLEREKLMLSSEEMVEWLGEHVTVYASGRARDGEHLCLQVSGTLRFTVKKGFSTIYDGHQVETAVETYNNLL
jgi:hypothetical protein